MGSSLKTTLARQRCTPGVLCVAMFVMMVLDQGVLVQTSIHPIGHTWKGEDVAIAFEYCGKNMNDKPDCYPMNFNFSSPNPACTLDDRYDHCQLRRVSDNDQRRADLEPACELCEIVVQGVSQADAGLYIICDAPPPCNNDFWRTLATLEFENDEASTVVTPVRLERTTQGSSSTPTTTASAPTKTNPETSFLPKTKIPSAVPIIGTGTAVGISTTIIIIIIVVVVALYFYKKRTGRRRQFLTRVPTQESVNENGNTAQTININLISKDVKIALVSEDTSLEADPE